MYIIYVYYIIYIYIFFYTRVPPRFVTHTVSSNADYKRWVLTVARSSSVRLESPVYRDDRRQADDHQVRRSSNKAPVLFHALTCKHKTMFVLRLDWANLSIR